MFTRFGQIHKLIVFYVSQVFSLSEKKVKNMQSKDYEEPCVEFPGLPVVWTLWFHCRRHSVDPCSGNLRFPHALWHSWEKKLSKTTEPCGVGFTYKHKFEFISIFIYM